MAGSEIHDVPERSEFGLEDTRPADGQETVPLTGPVSMPLRATMLERIDKYRLLAVLGRGGMGIVYLGQQTEPVVRKVAIKVLRSAGHDPDSSRRLRREANALARMKHENIAQVYDAGETELGAPYLVMEYIEGRPIDELCDLRRATIDERLQLFVAICHGIQHAHQKGIIHRDLKPLNVLCTDSDTPTPKIIDFGLAKERAGEKQTLDGFAMGTPAYMSPEQLDPMAEDVDTRTDVYSLGAFLYELLVGDMPHQIGDSSILGFLRRVRRDTPALPSVRALEMSVEAAEQRASTPLGLHRRLRGDLDWIVMRALDPERDRRYGSAAELAADIDLYLAHKPVSVGPPSAGYRVRKFVRRNRAAVLMSTLVLAALIIGATVATLGLVRAREAAERARISELETQRAAATAEAINGFLGDLLSSVDPRYGHRDIKLRTLIDAHASEVGERFREQPRVEASVRAILGRSYITLGQFEPAERHLIRALALYRERGGDDHPDALAVRAELVELELLRQRPERVRAYASELLARQERVLGPEHPATSSTRTYLGQAAYLEGDYERAETSLRAVLSAQKQHLGAQSNAVLASTQALARVLRRTGRYDEAEALQRDAFNVRVAALGADHPETIEAALALGNILMSSERIDEAAAVYRDIIERARSVLGDEHPMTLTIQLNLATAHYKRKRYERAETMYRDLVTRHEKVLGESHPTTLVAMNGLGNTLRRRSAYADAERIYRQTLERQSKHQGAEHTESVRTALNLIKVLVAQEKYADALVLSRDVSTRRPELEDGWTWLAEIHLRRGESELASAALKRHVELAPNSFKARAKLGLALLRSGADQAARQAYQRALALRPERAAIEGHGLAPLRAQMSRGAVSEARGAQIVHLLEGYLATL